MAASAEINFPRGVGGWVGGSENKAQLSPARARHAKKIEGGGYENSKIFYMVCFILGVMYTKVTKSSGMQWYIFFPPQISPILPNLVRASTDTDTLNGEGGVWREYLYIAQHILNPPPPLEDFDNFP